MRECVITNYILSKRVDLLYWKLEPNICCGIISCILCAGFSGSRGFQDVHSSTSESNNEALTNSDKFGPLINIFNIGYGLHHVLIELFVEMSLLTGRWRCRVVTAMALIKCRRLPEILPRLQKLFWRLQDLNQIFKTKKSACLCWGALRTNNLSVAWLTSMWPRMLPKLTSYFSDFVSRSFSSGTFLKPKS